MPALPLSEIVSQGLLKMMARQLDYSPAADDLGKCILVMADDLAKAGFTGEHAKIIADTLDTLGRSQTRWPTVSEIIQHARSLRRQQTAAVAVLPAPVDESGRERIRKLIKQVRSSQSPEPGPVRPELTPELEAQILAEAGVRSARVQARVQAFSDQSTTDDCTDHKF